MALDPICYLLMKEGPGASDGAVTGNEGLPRAGTEPASVENGSLPPPISATTAGALSATTEWGGNTTFSGAASSDDVYLDMAVHMWVDQVIIPVICAFGVVGNLLNLLIFIRRISQGPVESMERSATVGLIALATYDLLFCVVTVMGVFMPPEPLVYEGRSVQLYYAAYKSSLTTILTTSSVWITVVIALERYAVVSHPIKVRQFRRLRHTACSTLMACLIGIIIDIPLLWEKNIRSIHCGSTTFYWLDNGKLYDNEKLRLTFVYMWMILGLLVPIGILAFCNVSLIRALRQSWSTSMRLRQEPNQNVMQNRRITITLVVIVAMVFVLVCPTEIIQFYLLAFKHEGRNMLSNHIAFSCTKVLQALNFSINFILYGLIHHYFRRTVLLWLSKILRCPLTSGTKLRRVLSFTLSLRTNIATNSTYAPPEAV